MTDSENIFNESNDTLMNPKDLIQLGIDRLCSNAEEYFKKQIDTNYHMAKPFASLDESPPFLYRLGLLFNGLKLVPTMKVLDFGAGACWLTRILCQLKCRVISLDVSKTALDIGRQLFDHYPLIEKCLEPPHFLLFDGHKINLPDQSVDRVVCFDVFHHVPNQKEVLSEIFRVLKTDGIVGFSEPGMNHSQSPMAQYEMKRYHVLENDICLHEIQGMADKIGFSKLSISPTVGYGVEINLEEHDKLRSLQKIPSSLQRKVLSSIDSNYIFFLYKEECMFDSRWRNELRHSISMSKLKHISQSLEPVRIKFIIENTGKAKWLNKNMQEIGVVKLVISLYDSLENLIDPSFYACTFDKVVYPDEEIEIDVALRFKRPGKYVLYADLVSACVCLFQQVGSEKKRFEVIVKSPCIIKTKIDNYRIKQNETIKFEIMIKNISDSTWLCQKENDIGTIKIGGHLYRKNGELVQYDFLRKNLEKDIFPGENILVKLNKRFDEVGQFKLVIDLVSEYVCWFEQCGATPITIDILVE